MSLGYIQSHFLQQFEWMSSNLLLSGHSAEVLAIGYNQNTTILASAGVDRSIMLWSALQNYDNTATLKGHSNAVTALTWTYTDRLLTASADKSIVNWDVQQQKPVRKYKSHKCIIHDVATPKKTLEIFASVGDDGLVKIWQPRSKQEIKNITLKYPITSVSFSLHGDRIFAGGIDNEIKIINVGESKVEEVIQGHQDTVSSLQISFDGSYLMSNSFDETIRIWDVRPSMTGGKRLKKTLSGHAQGNEKSLIRGGWSIDGLYICCGSTDKCVYIWDTTTKKIVQRLGGHNGTVNQSVMGKGNWLASCSNDKSIIVSQLPEILL